MPSLSVRKIDDETIALLKLQASVHGVSMEEEVRNILKMSVTPRERLGDMAVRLFSPLYGDTSFAVPKRETAEPLNFL